MPFHKNGQILTILLWFLAFLSNFWQIYIWYLAKTGHFQPLGGACLDADIFYNEGKIAGIEECEHGSAATTETGRSESTWVCM